MHLLPLSALPLLALAFALPARGQGVGLEFPARAAAAPGRFLSGAYVSGNYVGRGTPGVAAYAVQPYVRYLLGRPGRVQPFLQYNFAPYAVQAYGSLAPAYAPGGPALPANPAFSPLGMHDPGLGNLGGAGGFSVGVPVRLGAGNRLMLNVGGNVLRGLLR